jgi:hypothetical protein
MTREYMMGDRETLWAYLEADDWDNAFRLCQELGWCWQDVVAQEMRSRAIELDVLVRRNRRIR